MNDGRTLLLLGADGFVGTHLEAAAKAIGLRVIGAARRPGAELQFDLGDPDSVTAAVRRASPDLVVKWPASPRWRTAGNGPPRRSP